jgi:hypothetical protein
MKTLTMLVMFSAVTIAACSGGATGAPGTENEASATSTPQPASPASDEMIPQDPALELVGGQAPASAADPKTPNEGAPTSGGVREGRRRLE